MSKPHKGNLYHWRKSFFNQKEFEKLYGEDCGLGYIICGYRSKVARMGTYWQTSWVVAYDPETGEIETRNSHYTLVGKEVNFEPWID